ncbi:VOC family protein [Kineosporia sp. J2-2]|uniref:VOC family protein n=1 Tax=Kineosporia corallincola TaxID=2835133 RepID=A0ABS5TF96_9ACTN|nr:VOC family protein [Kineosporia corallincola]MBT0769727.1 VOC family protein [Kineosporia corallincola]
MFRHANQLLEAHVAIRTEHWRAGTPCWTELVVDDAEEAKAFYGPLLGWSFERSTSEHSLVVATVDGVEAAGISEIHEDVLRSPSEELGRPTGWLTYFATGNLAAAVEAVQANDGQVLLPPRPAGTRGHRAVACDPTGAPFGLWQAGDAIGAAHTREAGAFVWCDLRSSEPARARAFYGRVFGLTHEPLPPEAGGDGDYQTISLPGDPWPLGGIGPMMGETDASPYWLVYFQVRDLAHAQEFVESTGGRIERRAFDTPFGRMAAVRDPRGSRFWLMQPQQ